MWLFYRRRHAIKITNGAQADVQIQLLAQSHVERTNAAAHRRGERAFDGNHIFFERLHGFCWQPHIGPINAGRFFACIDFHPADLALAAVGFGYSRIYHFNHDGGDVKARAVAFDKGDDGLVRHIQRHIGIDGDFLPVGGDFDVLVHGCSVNHWGKEKAFAGSNAI